MSQRVTGRVKWFNNSKGFGFIELGEGNDVFVHFKEITGEGYRSLTKDQRVEFTVVDGPKGLHAEAVVKLSAETGDEPGSPPVDTDLQN